MYICVYKCIYNESDAYCNRGSNKVLDFVRDCAHNTEVPELTGHISADKGIRSFSIRRESCAGLFRIKVRYTGCSFDI